MDELIQLADFGGEELMKMLGISIDEASNMLPILFDIAAKVIESAIIVVVAMIITHFVRSAISKFFKLPGKVTAKSETLCSVLRNFTKYLIGFFAVCEILSLFGVAVQSILAVAGVGGVAIGFGAQTIVKDVLTGILILMENQYNVGEVVRINGLSGVIESVGIRTTKIRDANGNLHILPNSAIIVVSNLSRDYRRPTIDLEFPASYSVESILGMLTDEMEKAGPMEGLTKPPMVQGLVDLSPSKFTVQIQAECDAQYCWPIERELRRLIKLRFEKENIS